MSMNPKNCDPSLILKSLKYVKGASLLISKDFGNEYWKPREEAPLQEYNHEAGCCEPPEGVAINR